jgi:hypothetical protein
MCLYNVHCTSGSFQRKQDQVFTRIYDDLCFEYSKYFHDSDRQQHTDKKENKIFLIYKEIQSGAVAKSTVYEEGLPNI